MLKIFDIPDFRSLRIIWLMEELGEPCQVEPVAYPIEDAFRTVGTGTVPAIDDDGVVMGESIAILQYLTGRRIQRALELGLTVGPQPDPAAYAEHLQFLHLGEASLMTPATLLAITRRMAPEAERANFTAARCERNVVNRLKVIERQLEDGRPWLTGQRFTIADISVAYALHYMRARELEGLFGRNTLAYLDRATSREAFKRAAAH
jgi:glutathione S-transferase